MYVHEGGVNVVAVNVWSRHANEWMHGCVVYMHESWLGMFCSLQKSG
jgi:hypothetical protein